MSITAKLKAEREKFYDALLQKILALPQVKEDREEYKLQYKELSEYELDQNVLDNFFEGDSKDILAVEEIWNMIKEEIREEAEWRTSDAKTFLHDYDDLNAEDIMNDKLGEIQTKLEDALKLMHSKT